MAVTISSELTKRVLALAAADPEREICGLLLGTPDSIVAVVPTANVALDPFSSFEIDPSALFAAHRAARAGGAAIVGCYHSHPSESCAPSPRDAAAAVPGQLWLIATIGGLALFRAEADGRFSRRTIRHD